MSEVVSAEVVRDGNERLGRHVNCLELHDIDRNLLKTEILTEIIWDKLGELGVDIEKLKGIKQEIEDSAGSFDTFSEVRKLYNDEDLIGNVKQAVIAEAEARKELGYHDPKSLYYRGARELIQRKPPEDTIRAFLTRGGQETQMLKLAIFGVDLDDETYAILPPDDKTKKAEMCVESYDASSGNFLFKWLVKGRPGKDTAPQVVNIWAERVVVIDDKADELVALGQLPLEKAIGFWHRSGEMKRSQELPEGVELPGNVHEIHSLIEVGQFLSRLGMIALGSTKEWTQQNRFTTTA